MNGRLITLEQIVSQTADLPSIPAAAIRVMRETQRAEASAATVAEHLATDQALSVRVLRLANSPFYGLSRRVGNLSEAVVVLGMRSVKNLALVASTYPWMTRPLPGYSLGPNEMWRHAFATAVGAQQIATISRKVKDDVAFTAGLLHDIGKVALSVWIDNKIQAIAFYSQREGIPFDEAERKVLGYDHTQVGEHLAKAWNLPEEICEVVRFHHQPKMAPSGSPLVDCVHVGDYLAMSMGFGLGGDGLQYALESSSMDRLGIKFEDIDEISDAFLESYERYETMFSDVAA